MHGPFFFELHRRSVGEITFDGTDVLEQASDKYFQIDSAWGASYRSQSLGDRSFPRRRRRLRGRTRGRRAEFSDYDLGPDTPVRRVVFKPSPASCRSQATRTSRFIRNGRPPGSRARARVSRRARIARRPRNCSRARPICIQCAASTRDRDAALAAVKDGPRRRPGPTWTPTRRRLAGGAAQPPAAHQHGHVPRRRPGLLRPGAAGPVAAPPPVRRGQPRVREGLPPAAWTSAGCRAS